MVQDALTHEPEMSQPAGYGDDIITPADESDAAESSASVDSDRSEEAPAEVTQHA